MLSNLLRIFITKQTINKVQEEQQRLLAEQRELTNRMAQSTNKEESESYRKQLEKMKKERIHYCTMMPMANEIVANAKAFFPIILLFCVLVVILSISLSIMEIIQNGRFENILIGIVLVLLMCTLIYVYIYIYNYYKNTMCLYYVDRVCIRRYRKKDVTVTYDEIRKCIKEKKIKVRNSCFEYPHKKGRLKIYISGELMPDKFYKFVNEKSGVHVLKLDQKQKMVMVKNGIGWTFYGVAPILFFVFELLLLVLGTIGDYGLHHTKEEILAFVVDLLFSPRDSFALYIGIFLIVLGFVLKIIFYFPTKNYFKNYEDIKVSLF